MDIEKEHNQFSFSFPVYRDDLPSWESPWDTEYETVSRDELIALRDKINLLLGE